MLPTTNGNLIFSALGSVAAPTSVVSVNPQVATAGLLSSSSVSGGGVKAVAAQFFSNSCAANALVSHDNGDAALVSLADAVVSKGISSIFAPGVVSLFDSPCYVSVDQPDVINTDVDATFFAGGYSLFEKNSKMYSEMDENEAAKEAGREDDDEDDEANDNAKATAKKKPAGRKSADPAAKVRSANMPLAVIVVRGHRTATLSPCRNFIYVLRTDSLALDWAVDLSAYQRPLRIKQLTLLDAHRLFILTDEGEVFFASRALVPSVSVGLLPTPRGYDGTDNRLQSDNKFRYFVTKTITPVTITKSDESSSIVSFQPLKCAHVEKSGSIVVDIVAVLKNSAETNTFTVTSGAFNIAQRSGAVTLELAASSQTIKTTVSPSSFLVSVASAIDASSKKKIKGNTTVPMNVLVTPLGAAISTSAAEKKPLTLAHLVAMDGAKLKVSSVTPVTVAAADVRKRGGASTEEGFFVSATTAELLNESMLSVGIVRGEGSVATASQCVVTGMAVLGTFYAENEEKASAGFAINTSAIHLSDETSTLSRMTSSSATASAAVELAPVGFYYNARLNQQTIVTISSLSTSTSSSSTVDSSADAIAVRICGISLLSGFPANGSAIAKGSWVSVNSVLSGNNGNNVASLNNNAAANALINVSEEVDRYTNGGKRSGLESRNFVTLNYPIVTLSERSPAAYLDPYRINSAAVFGRCAVTAPVAIHARTLTQWPNAVIGVLKMLVDFTTIALAHAYNIRYAHETLLLGGEIDVPLPPTTAAGIISTAVLELFKKLASTSNSLSSLFSGNAAERNNSTAFEVSILTHAFHPSAVRNALRRLPFAVKAASEATERAKLIFEQEETVPVKDSRGFHFRQKEIEEEDKLFKEENDRLYKKTTGDATITADDLVNGLFAALLDGVDASSSQLVSSSSSSAGNTFAGGEDGKLLQHISADSFLRSAVGALEVCHQLITLQTQIGATLKGALVSRFVLLLRSLRVLGGECDQIAGRLSATLDRQRVAAANAEALAMEKAMIRKYQEASQKKEVILSDEASTADDTISTHHTIINSVADVQQKVNLSRADIRHKIAAVGTGNVADSLSAQLRTHKKVLDLVESKIEAKLKAREMEKKKKQNETAAKAVAFGGLPLYASAGMRQLKSDFQDSYERFLLLGVSNKQ